MCKENGALLNEQPKQQDMFVPQQEEQLEQPLMNNVFQQEQLMNNAPMQQEQQKSMTELLSEQKNTADASSELERTAEAGFKQGINSRPGACETRNTKKKKAAARTKLNGEGLSAYSGDLSKQLVKTDIEQQIKAQESEEYIEKHEKVLQKNGDYLDPITAKLAAPLLPWLESDESRKDLLSQNKERGGGACSQLMEQAMKFQLEPNALCTLPAVQRAADVVKYSTFAEALFRFVAVELGNDGIAAIPRQTMERFKSFKNVLESLKLGTQATVELQGLNLQGAKRYEFREEMTSEEKTEMESSRSSSKSSLKSHTKDYAKRLNSYNELVSRQNQQ